MAGEGEGRLEEVTEAAPIEGQSAFLEHLASSLESASGHSQGILTLLRAIDANSSSRTERRRLYSAERMAVTMRDSLYPWMQLALGQEPTAGPWEDKPVEKRLKLLPLSAPEPVEKTEPYRPSADDRPLKTVKAVEEEFDLRLAEVYKRVKAVQYEARAGKQNTAEIATALEQVLIYIREKQL